MRAFYQLVTGLRKHPTDEQALEMLVDIYIRDIETPGVERDLLLTLNLVPEGVSIYEMIQNALEKSDDHRRLKSLLQTKELERLFESPEPEAPPISTPNPIGYPRETAPHSPVRRSQATFAPSSTWHAPQAIATPQQTPVRAVSDVQEPRQESLKLPDPEPVAPPVVDRQRLDCEPARDFTPPSTESSSHYDDERATTGVFSSIDVYLQDQDDGLEQVFAQRSRKRLLIVAAVVLTLILALIFIRPTPRHDATDQPSETPDVDEITQPIPHEDHEENEP